jgi:hypothetical protein
MTSAVLIGLVALVSAAPATLAHDPSAASDAPEPGDASTGPGFGGADAYKGRTSFTETCSSGGTTAMSSDETSATSTEPEGNAMCPDHSATMLHKHIWLKVNRTYLGYYHYNSQRSCIGPCSLSWTETRSTSNAWGASIGFAPQPISGALKYDVTFSRSYSFQVTLQNTSPGVNKQGWYSDHMDTTLGDIRTDWYYDSFKWHYCCTTYGGGWGARFTNRTYWLKTI